MSASVTGPGAARLVLRLHHAGDVTTLSAAATRAAAPPPPPPAGPGCRRAAALRRTEPGPLIGDRAPPV